MDTTMDTTADPTTPAADPGEQPARRGPGRPRTLRGDAQGARITVRVSRGELAGIQRMAAAAGHSPATWARDVILRALP